MSARTIGIALVVIGVLMVLVGLLAGYIGLSSSTAIGPNKLLMAGAGLVVGIIGVILALRKKAS